MYTFALSTHTCTLLSRLTLQMWTHETGVSFAIEEAKIDGRKISYPYGVNSGESTRKSILHVGGGVKKRFSKT